MSVSYRSAFSSMSPNKSISPRYAAIRVDDSPVQDFVKVIESNPQGAWQKRTSALENLIRNIPEGSAYHAAPAWYNNPPTLRHLANGFGELLHDPRSTVVKRTCGCLLLLFSRCQSDARYLFKDMMPTILAVHATTVQVIRQAVQFMVMEAIPEVPCKMVMPLWMERLKIDKSRTVREACTVFLGHALQSWTEEGYLTDEIWMQVGKALVASLRDPSPTVRASTKTSLEIMQRMQPIYFDNLINDPDGAAARDPKLARWLLNLGQGNNPDTEELSVMSRISYNSDIRSARNKSAGVPSSASSVGSASPRKIAPSPRYNTAPLTNNTNTNNFHSVPTSIALARRDLPPNGIVSKGGDNVSSSKRPSGLTPPTRRGELFARQLEPVKIVTHAEPIEPISSSFVSPTNRNSTPDNTEPSPMADSVSLMSNLQIDTNVEPEEPYILSPSSLPSSLGVPTLRESMQVNRSQDERKSTDSMEKQLPPQESPSKTEPAKIEEPVQDRSFSNEPNENLSTSFLERRSRNSALIQQRFRMSSMESQEENEPSRAENGQTRIGIALQVSPLAVPPPEHVVIAIRLLKGHKAHVDAIMETLRIEMDTLRDFDRLLEEPGRPTEEEVLNYFESVALCLEQRTVAGIQMQEELDRVSRGEPPNA